MDDSAIGTFNFVHGCTYYEYKCTFPFPQGYDTDAPEMILTVHRKLEQLQREMLLRPRVKADFKRLSIVIY